MDAGAMEAFGLTEEDMEETNTFYLFPDNVIPFHVFEFMGTQWRTSHNGITGLDYNIIPLAFGMVGVDDEDKPEVMSCVRTMENVTLTLWNNENEKKRK